MTNRKILPVLIFNISMFFSSVVWSEVPEMISIPSGSFLMGACKESPELAEENRKRSFIGLEPLPSNCSAGDEIPNDNEIPQHLVNIKSFKMSKTEITLGQFKKFIVEAKRSDLLTVDFMENNDLGDNAPVVWVTWKDALDYTIWLSDYSGETFRLPTEAEWEYACLAGKKNKFCGSDNPHEVGWFYDKNDDNPGKQREVAKKKPNAFGLYDMSGNVSEWVQDCLSHNYNGAPDDGTASVENCYNDLKVFRGGYWLFGPTRATARDGMSIRVAARIHGFRVAQSLRASIF